MATNPNWPLVVDQIAFTGDPNDPNATPAYTDVTARVRSFETSRGRQYEIDQNQTGEAHLTVSDSDEVLNPANTSAPAPYAGNIKPYRRYLRQAMWPPVPVGGANNLLNANAVPTGYDPDFENTAVGGTPPNVLKFNTNPTVQAANPFHGTKSLQWSVAGNSTEQVTGFNIPCIPGRPYVASVYYRQTAANTGVIFINNGAPGNSTTTTGAYVRLSVAFVASQPTHQLYMGSYTPTLASTVNLDAIQLEPVSPLNANPTFETGTSSWTAAGGTIGLSNAWQQQGLYSLLLTPNGVSSQCFAESELIPVTPNTRYLVAGFVYAPNAIGSFDFGINWYDASHAYISSSATGISLSANSVTERDDQFTSPANAAYATVVPTINGTPTTSQQVYVDNVALYPATPSTFSTSGPTIYTPFAGYVERWPSSWNHQGTYGLCAMACVDAMATLAGTDLHTEYRGALLAKNPDYYWPLADGSSTTTWAEVSGNNGPSLVRVDGKYGPAPTFSSGTQVAIAGDPGATGLAINGGDPTVTNGPASVAQTGFKDTPSISVGSASLPLTFSVAAWVVHTTASGATSDFIALSDPNYATFFSIFWQGSSTNKLGVQMIPANGPTLVYAPSVADAWGDGKPHLIVATVNVGTSTGVANLYIDGTLVSAGSPQTTTSWVGPFNLNAFQIGSGINVLTGNNDPCLPGGTYAHVALFKRVLSAQDVTDLWNAGKGYPGETSGQRIARLLSVGGYTGPTAIDTGQSVMDASTVTEGAALLDACQAVTLSENGNLYVEAGVVTAKSRTDRYLKTTATWVFGENQAGGEYPYEADIAYDYDPTRAVNDVTVTRVGGAKANATDATSQKQYFRRSYQRTVGIQSDLEAIDAANYLLGQGKQPIQRVSRLSIKPSANPALWPVALGARIGDRVTVKRRTPAFTMSSDYFIEKIDHTDEPGSWVTTFQMSPVGRYQVGIFDDATYGRFDQTLIFGY